MDMEKSSHKKSYERLRSKSLLHERGDIRPICDQICLWE